MAVKAITHIRHKHRLVRIPLGPKREFSIKTLFSSRKEKVTFARTLPNHKTNSTLQPKTKWQDAALNFYGPNTKKFYDCASAESKRISIGNESDFANITDLSGPAYQKNVNSSRLHKVCERSCLRQH